MLKLSHTAGEAALGVLYHFRSYAQLGGYIGPMGYAVTEAGEEALEQGILAEKRDELLLPSIPFGGLFFEDEVFQRRGDRRGYRIKDANWLIRIVGRDKAQILLISAKPVLPPVPQAIDEQTNPPPQFLSYLERGRLAANQVGTTARDAHGAHMRDAGLTACHRTLLVLAS